MEDQDAKRNAVSRRQFLKAAGAFVVLGAAGTARLDALASLLRSGVPGGKQPDLTGSVPSGKDECSFTVFWITDTQYLSESNPTLYSEATAWIVKNWGLFNGKLVIHTGDLVETGSELQQWVNAATSMTVLTNNNIPYLWCAGNHDDLVINDATSGWAGSQFDAFNPGVMSQKINSTGYTQWAGDFHDGMNTAVTFSAGGLNFLVVNLEWNAQADALDWLEGLLSNELYQDHYVIIAPHAYEDAYGSTDDARWGPTLADFRKRLAEIMDEHRYNVFLTLNGHFATDSGYHTPAPVNERNQLMFDRQESTDDPKDPIDSSVDDVLKVGGATITLLTFDVKLNTVTVRTFDPYNSQYRTGSMDQYSFAMYPERGISGLSPNNPLITQRVPA